MAIDVAPVRSPVLMDPGRAHALSVTKVQSDKILNKIENINLKPLVIDLSYSNVSDTSTKFGWAQEK